MKEGHFLFAVVYTMRISSNAKLESKLLVQEVNAI